MARHPLFDRLLSIARRATPRRSAGPRTWDDARSANARGPNSASSNAASSNAAPSNAPRRPSPGDFHGVVRPVYEPVLDGDGDPGEIVWTWVPYEEDASRGKDRPVLVVGRDGPWLLGLMLTSKDHARDAADEARHGRFWLDVGSGAWDAQRRPSEIRLDRVLRLDPTAVRREGAIMDRVVFDRVATWLRSR